MRKWVRVTGAGLGAVVAAGALIGGAFNSAYAADGSQPVATQPTGPAAGAPRAAATSVAASLPGKKILVTGSGWPANTLVTATVCGNQYLMGSVDCTQDGAGQNNTGPDGSFQIEVTVGTPPKPCPCVVHVANAADPKGVDLPFVVIGAPTATPQGSTLTTSLDVSMTLSGSGPWKAYFGGAAQRELTLAVTNTGTTPVTNPTLNLAFGKGSDPTEPLLGPDGLPPQLGTIQPGQTTQFRQPITISAPSFGQYRVRGSFVGINAVSVDSVPLATPDSPFYASTSTYPWALIIVGWLILQIPLLGLYKRRTVIYDTTQEDPLVEELPVASGVVPPGFGGGVFDAESAPPVVSASPFGPGAVVAGAAVGAAVASQAPAAPQPVYAAPVPPVVPASVPAAPVVASSVFGVNDLRAMLQQPAATASAAAVAAAPEAAAAPAAPAAGVDALRSLLEGP